MNAHQQRIHLIVACSDRKTAIAPPGLCLRDVPGNTTTEQAGNWIERLETVKSVVLPASGLYAGLHWSILSQLQLNAATINATLELHVCSGGYGLIRWDSLVKPYGATFTPRHADSIGAIEPTIPASTAGTVWWNALAEWSGPHPHGARSIAEVARVEPDCTIVVVAGPHYLRAMRDDLKSAAASMRRSEQLVIVSAGLRRLPGDAGILNAHLMACDARWEHRFPVSRTGISAAIAADLLRRAAYTPGAVSNARHAMERENDTLPPLRSFHRSRLSDDEVCRFVATRLGENDRLAFGALLREFRDQGLACEYTRFRAIYRSTKEYLHAAKAD